MTPGVPSILPLRITVEHPIAGVVVQVQCGRDQLLPPTRSTPGSVSFDLTVRLGPARVPGELRLLGEYVQGPPAARFIYVNSGVRAGQHGSCWDRRAKVKLGGITRGQVDRVMADNTRMLEARISGSSADGGPMCGSVPLLGEGWVVIEV